jgi:hypothetical protein
MKPKFSRTISGPIFYGLFIAAFLSVSCEKVSDNYTPPEWVEMFKKAGGWVPLPFPDSKYRPGAIVKVSEKEGIRWISHLESCRYPEEVLRPEKSYIPGITFTKGKDFGAAAMVNFKGISAGPAFDKVSKVRLEVQDHGADAFKLINLKVWWEEPKNRKKVSSACLDELKKPDHYLITEAFRVSKGTYTLYDKSGAALKLSAPKLGDLLQFQPDVKYEVTSDGKLTIEQPVYFAIRMAVRVGDDFEVLGEQTQAPQTADSQIEKLFLKGY